MNLSRLILKPNFKHYEHAPFTDDDKKIFHDFYHQDVLIYKAREKTSSLQQGVSWSDRNFPYSNQLWIHFFIDFLQ